MDSDHCRKATEFWDAAETSRDNLADRLAWLLLAQVWCSLTNQLDETARKSALNLGERLRERLEIN